MLSTHYSRRVIDLPNPKIKPFKEKLESVGRKKGNMVLGEMAMSSRQYFCCKRVNIGDFDYQETARLENTVNNRNF